MAEAGVRKWLPLAVMALALFIVVLDTTIINVSIKAIIGDLHSNLKAVQWVITGYSLVLAAFTITGGRLGDIFGRRRMFMIGAIIFAIGSLLASRAHSAAWLLGSVSLIEAAGAAIMLPSTASLILATYRNKDRAIAFGVYGAVAGAAATIGPIVGGFLTTNYSWRWNYLINPMVVVVLLAGSVLIKESHETHPHRPDISSIVLSALGLGGMVYGIIESSTYGWIKAKGAYEIFNRHYGLHGVSITVYSLILGVAFLGLFLWRQSNLERRRKVPLVSLALFKNNQFITGTTVTLVLVLAQFGFIFALPVFFQGLLGKDAFHTGLAMLPFSLGLLLGAPVAGVLAGKKNVPPRYLIQIGLVMSVVGAFLLHGELRADSVETTFLPGLTVFGLGFGLSISQLANLTLSAVSVNQAGEASGVNNTFRQVGSSLGQALIGALLISALATQLTKDIAASTVLAPSMKGQVASAIAANAESLGATGPSAGANQLPDFVMREIQHIKNDAIVKGTRTAMLGTTIAMAVALVISLRLPKRSVQYAEDLGAAER